MFFLLLLLKEQFVIVCNCFLCWNKDELQWQENIYKPLPYPRLTPLSILKLGKHLVAFYENRWGISDLSQVGRSLFQDQKHVSRNLKQRN